ncbi:MAG TPA: type II secretion system protein [Burkholderiales bacterium]|nr:type II secretion system protein [Burkholderiales bacterium]
MRTSRSLAGFTLIELIITVAIIGILASVAVPFAELSVRRAKEQELRIALRQIRTAIDDYKKAGDEGRIERLADTSGYPVSLAVLEQGVENAQDPENKSRIYFIRRIPRDPFFSDGSVAAADTWGKRSYESPPTEPRPGKDVFDVYSLSQESGINGVPYRQW